jgi:UDP-sugar diphosphatase
VGISGARQTCYYAEVDESMRVGRGGGNLVEGEEIDVVGLPVDQIDKFIMDESIPKSAGVMWATTWLLAKLREEESRQKA